MSEAPRIGHFGAIVALKSTGSDGVELDAFFKLRSAMARVTRPWRVQRAARSARLVANRARRLSRKMSRWSDDRVLASVPALTDGLTGTTPRRRAKYLAAAAAFSDRILGLTPHTAQLEVAALLMDAKLAELETGAGKTLASALAAVAAARLGERVHLITANAYLAERDQRNMLPLYQVFGLSSGLVVEDGDKADRFAAYRVQILHASGKELAFDYLRNRLLLGADAGPVQLAFRSLDQRGASLRHLTVANLPFAIVDEADSVLIDECRTPLIISAVEDSDPDWAKDALRLADALETPADYTADSATRRIELTPEGKDKLADLADTLGGIWANTARREDAAQMALSARHFYHRDEHYVVQDGKIELIDEFTGRVAEGRALGNGLHQIVECLEDVPVTGRRVTQGRITYQRLFRRYGRLSGTTGTALEVATELKDIYNLEVVPVQSPFRSRRNVRAARIAPEADAKWQAVVAEVEAITSSNRPVLIATRTIRASAEVGKALEDAGIKHVLLNATQSRDEAEIIAEAGIAGRVTVATNMAGRGVDIVLSDDARAAGGLHVILTERHEAGRIDRQVIGRTARQGDPGSVQPILAKDDALLDTFGSAKGKIVPSAFDRAQKRAEQRHAQARLDLLHQEQQRDRTLSFSGASE